MAAPSVRGVTVPIITTGAINQPSATQVGDLVLFWVWSQNTTIPTHTLQSGFTEIRSHSHDDGTTDGRLSVAYRVATQAGTVALTPYVVTAAANQTSGGAVAIPVGEFDVSSLPTSNSATLTTNAVPNPPSATGLTGDYRVFASAGWHVTTTGATAATAMTNYAIDTQNAAASHVTHLAIASRALTSLSAATEDPGAFGDNVAPNGSASMTIAIKGVIAVGATSSQTQASNTSTGTATVAVSATSSLTQAADTSAATAGVSIAASASLTQAADTATSTAAVTAAGVGATASLTQAADSATGTGSIAIGASSSLTQAAQTAAATGAVSVGASSSLTQAADSATSTASASVGASTSVTQAAQTSAATTTVLVGASSTQTQGEQTAAATATNQTAPALATSSTTQSADSASSTAGVVVGASVTVTQGAQTAASTTTAAIGANGSLTQSADTCAVSAGIIAGAVAALAQDADALAALASNLPEVGASASLEQAEHVLAISVLVASIPAVPRKHSRSFSPNRPNRQARTFGGKFTRIRRQPR